MEVTIEDIATSIEVAIKQMEATFGRHTMPLEGMRLLLHASMPQYINEWYTTCFLKHQMIVRHREQRWTSH